ncbi:MAG: radical SAM protein [Clostridia bacterium]|nr:radical SAM protein [Clostridia bacterium]MBQ5792190.1 radical SAM protein [Clostridia bacterium]
MECTLCPRHCMADREKNTGFCGASNLIKVARAAPHLWEEPCLSGEQGSGTIFFSGCQLKCVYCQNREISDGGAGKSITTEELTALFFRLASTGVHNINLVTPDPYLPQVAEAIHAAKQQGFSLPFVMNCSGYETVSSLRLMEGLVDVYLPDFKYMSPLLAKKYSRAPDYPAVAKAALSEMFRQQPALQWGSDGMLKKGIIVRHLLLPGHIEDSKRVLAYLHQTYGDSIYISIMSQFTPLRIPIWGGNYPELNRTVTEEEYDALIDFACRLGIQNAFIQDGSAASESFIPAFNGEGV